MDRFATCFLAFFSPLLQAQQVYAPMIYYVPYFCLKRYRLYAHATHLNKNETKFDKKELDIDFQFYASADEEAPCNLRAITSMFPTFTKFVINTLQSLANLFLASVDSTIVYHVSSV